MILRTEIVKWNGAANVSYGGVGLVLTIDGTVIVNTADIAGLATPLAPVTTTNGYSVIFDVEGSPGVTKVTIAGLNPWESVDVRQQITYAGYRGIDKTIKVFGYDLGNSIGGAPVNTNNRLTLVLVINAFIGTSDWANVIAYREPFTKRIRYYNNTGTSARWFNASSGSDVFIGTSDGFIASDEETTIKLELQGLSGGVDTHTVVIPAAQWVPSTTFSVNAPVGCIDEDCYTILSQFSALLSIDFASATTLYINGVNSYATDKYEIRYRIYDSGGAVVSEKSYGFIKVVATSYVATDYEWLTAQLPEEGSYVVEACLIGMGVHEGDLLDDTSGIPLVEGNWYLVTSAGLGTENWTGTGTVLHPTLGTAFMATGVQPSVWEDVELESLGEVFEYCTRETVLGCSPYMIEQEETCNEYTITNNDFDTISVRIKAMNSDGEFETITDGDFTLDATLSRTDSFALDNIYIYEVYDSESGDTIYTKVILNYCALRTCLLEYINDLICKCVTLDNCTNYCKDFYNFNALVVVAHTYFNMMNQEYNFNFSYTTLDPSKVADLYTAKQVLDRFTDYCESCTDCSCGSSSNCSCN